jgi:hypothetical protein
VQKLLYLIFGLDLVLGPFEARNCGKLGMLSNVRLAQLRWLSAFDKVLGAAIRALLSRKQRCRRIDLGADYTIGRSWKALAAKLGSQSKR